MSNLTPYDKKHLETAAYCISQMLQGEELSYEISGALTDWKGPKKVAIEDLYKLKHAVCGNFEITFEGSTSIKHLDFATLSDKAKDALTMLWKSPLAGVMHKKEDILRKYGPSILKELDNLLRQ